MTTKPKRYKYHITYDAKSKLWVCKVKGAMIQQDESREVIISEVSSWLADWYKIFNQHSKLIIHRKNGTIGRGSSSRRTYGADPKSRG
jgi:hypothetical protein